MDAVLPRGLCTGKVGAFHAAWPWYLPLCFLSSEKTVRWPLGKCLWALEMNRPLVSGEVQRKSYPPLGHWAGEGHLGSIPGVSMGLGQVSCPLVMPQFYLLHKRRVPYPLPNPTADSDSRVPC